MNTIYLNSDFRFALPSTPEFDTADTQLQRIWQKPSTAYLARAAEPISEQSQEERLAAFMTCVANGLPFTEASGTDATPAAETEL